MLLTILAIFSHIFLVKTCAILLINKESGVEIQAAHHHSASWGYLPAKASATNSGNPLSTRIITKELLHLVHPRIFISF